MRVDATEKSLRQFLRDRDRQLKSTTAADLLQLATEFWASSTVADTRDVGGDGLVAYFELLERGGTVFEFGVNRIMRPKLVADAPYQAWVPAWVLRFSIGFRPNLETFQLGAPVGAYNCWNKAEAATFVDEISRTPQFRHCLAQPQKSCSIKLYETTSPWGEPCHPTRGYSWAVG